MKTSIKYARSWEKELWPLKSLLKLSLIYNGIFPCKVLKSFSSKSLDFYSNWTQNINTSYTWNCILWISPIKRTLNCKLQSDGCKTRCKRFNQFRKYFFNVWRKVWNLQRKAARQNNCLPKLMIQEKTNILVKCGAYKKEDYDTFQF